LIIAEAGVNHNGDLVLARRLVDAAVDAGADVVKFQTFDSTRVATALAEKAAYQIEFSGQGETQQQMLKRLELSQEQHTILFAHCESAGIEFLSTAFDLPSVEMLAAMGLRRFKIPSGEITNLPYLRAIGHLGGRVILSTGMATLGEVESAVEVLTAAGTPRALITVLHCNTQYPAPVAEVNLRAMLAIRDGLGLSVGYSDHTLGTAISVAAVALGATVIEKHLTIDRSLPGPDHAASLEPVEFREMVKSIRDVEAALGDGIKWPTAGETPNRLLARKSIVAARSIRAGERLTDENITTKRPGTGLSPMRWDEVVGRISARDFEEDEFIE
jgi:N,N'-diacetyllegionaminate synthase